MALIQASFVSGCLKRSVKFNAMLPLDVNFLPGQEPPRGPFKTLYLLHGYTNGCYSWLEEYDMRSLCERNNLVIIMPDGENHFYVDAVRRTDMYGEFIGRELVEFTRKAFPLSHKRDDTSIAGISMGGYGALRNALKYNDVFGHAIGISPAYIIHELAESEDTPNNVGATRGYYESVFGDLDSALDSDLDLCWLARKLKADGGQFPDIYHACGYNDMLVFANRKFSACLDELGVSHVYEEGSGTHEPGFFWPHMLVGIDRLPLDRVPEPPNPFWIESAI